MKRVTALDYGWIRSFKDSSGIIVEFNEKDGFVSMSISIGFDNEIACKESAELVKLAVEYTMEPDIVRIEEETDVSLILFQYFPLSRSNVESIHLYATFRDAVEEVFLLLESKDYRFSVNSND